MSLGTTTPAGERILAAASDLFYERGITGVGVELIAAQAGVTKKTLYDRFSSKDELVVAYLQMRFEGFRRHVLAELDRTDATGVERPLAVLDALDSWLAGGNRGCGMINAYAELSRRSPAATAVVRAEKQWTRDLYERLLTEAGAASAPALARGLGIIHQGAVIESAAGGSKTALADARALAQGLLTGASAR